VGTDTNVVSNDAGLNVNDPVIVDVVMTELVNDWMRVQCLLVCDTTGTGRGECAKDCTSEVPEYILQEKRV
jgi:hypothetical protein